MKIVVKMCLYSGMRNSFQEMNFFFKRVSYQHGVVVTNSNSDEVIT